MMRFTDHLGNLIQLGSFPTRIVSLVPSQTELLYDLGLENEVVGITRFCIHPEVWRRSKCIIGGTKDFDFKAIAALQPDLIIGNKEENYAEGIAILQRHYPVWMSDIYDIKDAINTIAAIGELCGRQALAQNIIQTIAKERAQFKSNIGKTVAYFIWKKPYMVAASNTFIHAMLQEFGLQNIFGDYERYPELAIDTLCNMKPDLVFLSSEPYKFSQRHIPEFKAIFPNAEIMLVDGEMFSWYGSRLQHAFRYFKTLDLR